MNLAGTLTTTTLGTLNRTGATVQLSGTLDNTGSALTLGQAGPLTMDGGTIQGGTADLTSNNLVFTNGTGKLLHTSPSRETSTSSEPGFAIARVSPAVPP